MEALGNDRWRASFRAPTPGRYHYTVEAWIDGFGTWRHDFGLRMEARQNVRVDRLIGAEILDATARRATDADADRLHAWAQSLREDDDTIANQTALDREVARLADSYPDLRAGSRFAPELVIVVDRDKAEFSAWYEMFPRSSAREAGRHGTLRDCEAWLPYIAGMGFDVLYLPPIHPIGRTNRKGRNNRTDAGVDDVGSPWAIGSSEGGHKSIHPELGTLDDFRRLIDAARAFDIEIALDIAYQCSPDHPYVKEHPEWFRRRPDGTIQYAENPPKKYEDIYPFDFECDQWRALWDELKSVILFWVDQGVRILRVDNPHTKALAFWEWVITEVKAVDPGVIFLSEAFTRPRPMYRLAKLGFTQSYTYFTWRTSRDELITYFRELTETDVAEFFRPNLFVNTPDILHEYLQTGGRPAFMVRAVLAATLAASYGVYGPAFELGENEPREPGSEEYLNSEKYEIRYRDLDAPGSLRGLFAQLNRARADNPALHRNRGLRFHDTDNPMLLCYSRTTDDRSNVVLVVVNLDPVNRQTGQVNLDLASLGFDPARPFEAHDLLDDRHYRWVGPRNYVELTPGITPAHVLRLGPLAGGEA